MNIESVVLKANELILEVGKFISLQQEKISQDIVETKSSNSFVTYVDTTAEKMLVEGLQKILPGSGFLTEENTTDKISGDYIWIIDPLDGTTNFIHKLPPYAISVGLSHFGKMIAGIIYVVTSKELFYTWEGANSYLNNEKIFVTQTVLVKDSLIATGFPYYDYHKMAAFLNTMDYFMRNSHGLRRLGSAATDLAYLACGRFEAFYEYSLNPWDVAAGAIIVENAGGKVSDFSGGDNYIFGKEIIASNTLIHNEFSSVIENLMIKNLKH